MKILYIGTLPLHPGGTAIVGYQLLIGFAREGHSVRALAPITPETQKGAAAFDGSYPEISIQRFMMPHFELHPYFPYPQTYLQLEQEEVTKQLTRMIEENRPDVIMIGRETYVRTVSDLARTQNIPSVLTVHGGLTHGIVDGSHPPKLVKQLLEQYNNSELVITPSKHMAASLKRFGITCVIIPNPVDLNLFTPLKEESRLRPKYARPDEIVVTYVGHLRELKRSLDLVWIAEEALKRNGSLVFMIVGDGPLRSEMENLCREKNLSERFHFVGWINHSEVASYIQAADVIVTPTAIENQALIYLETQACEKVLLASDIPAAREVIEHGVTGFLFETGNIENCVDHLIRIAEHPDLREEVGRNSRNAVQIHSLDRCVESYLNEMQQLTSKALTIE